MQVILELDDCSIRVYRFLQSISNNYIYSSSFSHYHMICALNHCYQVGQYFKQYAQKRPKILKLCLRISYNSGIILSKTFTYYSQNYAGIIGTGLNTMNLKLNSTFIISSWLVIYMYMLIQITTH